jgi:hypothetical protein
MSFQRSSKNPGGPKFKEECDLEKKNCEMTANNTRHTLLPTANRNSKPRYDKTPQSWP